MIFVYVICDEIRWWVVQYQVSVWTVCIQNIPLHSFLQLFDGGIRGCWGWQRLLEFLSSCSEFLLLFIKTALQTVNTPLGLHIMVFAVLQLQTETRESTSSELLLVDLHVIKHTHFTVSVPSDQLSFRDNKPSNFSFSLVVCFDDS